MEVMFETMEKALRMARLDAIWDANSDVSQLKNALLKYDEGDCQVTEEGMRHGLSASPEIAHQIGLSLPMASSVFKRMDESADGIVPIDLLSEQIARYCTQQKDFQM